MRVIDLDRFNYKKAKMEIKEKLINDGLQGYQLNYIFTKIINGDINHAIKFLNS